jgi:hypothetical protein
MGIPFTQVEEAYDHGLRTYEIVIRDRPYLHGLLGKSVEE